MRPADYEARHIRQEEWPLLEDLLYEAIYVPEGFEGEVPRSVIYDDPKCRAAYLGFGALPDDRAMVAVTEEKIVGACWVRTTDEYGHIDGATPSFSISLYKPYRGRGVGTAMMHAMFDELHETGYARCSLSVQKENPALRLYERLGFRIVGNGFDETELRSKGHGSAIMDDLERMASASHPAAVLNSSAPAERFHLRRGYHTTEIREWVIRSFTKWLVRAVSRFM